MKLIEPKAEYISQEEGLEGIYKQIELAGRTCYKSEDKITEESAKPFVDRMIASKHLAMLEHGTVYLKIYSIAEKDWDRIIGRHKKWRVDDARASLRTNPTYDHNGEKNWWADDASHIAMEMLVKYTDNPYSEAISVLAVHELITKDNIIITPTEGYPRLGRSSEPLKSRFNVILITTNLRVLVENGWLDDLKYMCEPTKFHKKRYTFRFICDRGVSHELVRHRAFSFAQESQRYCNYSKEKYEREMTFIKPSWLNVPVGIVYWHDGICWRVQQDENNPMEWFSVKPQEDFSTKEAQVASAYFNALSRAEEMYFSLLREGCKAQEARAVLPNATKTEICMTGFASDFRHFFDLRLFGKTGAPHPDMLALANKAKEAAEEAGIWEDIMSYKSKFE